MKEKNMILFFTEFARRLIQSSSRNVLRSVCLCVPWPITINCHKMCAILFLSSNFSDNMWVFLKPPITPNLQSQKFKKTKRIITKKNSIWKCNETILVSEIAVFAPKWLKIDWEVGW